MPNEKNREKTGQKDKLANKDYARELRKLQTRLVGMQEWVRHEVNGLLFRQRDVEDLRRTLARFIADPHLVRRLSGNFSAVKTIGEDARNQYKRPVPDPNYPQYFAARQPAGSIPMFEGYGRNTRRIDPTQFCKVLEIEAGAETVVQDILLEPVK